MRDCVQWGCEMLRFTCSSSSWAWTNCYSKRSTQQQPYTHVQAKGTARNTRHRDEWLSAFAHRKLRAPRCVCLDRCGRSLLRIVLSGVWVLFGVAVWCVVVGSPLSLQFSREVHSPKRGGGGGRESDTCIIVILGKAASSSVCGGEGGTGGRGGQPTLLLHSPLQAWKVVPQYIKCGDISVVIHQKGFEVQVHLCMSSLELNLCSKLLHMHLLAAWVAQQTHTYY